MEPLHPLNSKKVYILMFTVWISYVIQIINILTFTLIDMDYYTNILFFDLSLFLLSCSICITITFAVTRNKYNFLMCSIILAGVYDAIILLSIYFLFSIWYNSSDDSKNITLLIIKIVEIIPSILIFINYNLISRPINQNIINNNNGIMNNNGYINNNFINNNNNNWHINNNNGYNNGYMNVNNGFINNNGYMNNNNGYMNNNGYFNNNNHFNNNNNGGQPIFY